MTIRNIMEATNKNNPFNSDLIIYLTAGVLAIYFVALLINGGRGALLDLI